MMQKEELTGTLINDMRNLEKFGPTLASLKTCTLMGSFCPNYIMLELKKSTEELCGIILKIGANFEGKMACVFINDMKNLVNSTEALKSLKICTLRDFSSKVYNVWAKKLQRSYVS